jgi:hypothetical protein
MGTDSRERVERLRRIASHELTKTLIPVALVIGFGLIWVRIRPEFFWQDDYQTQYLPATREIARALSEGNLPILTARNWFGAALAGEFQHGVFSLSTLVVCWFVWQLGLSLPATAAALSLFHLSVAAAGAFRLARARALDVSQATLVGVVTGLNGWLIFWGKGWYPSVTSFAWVPWAWWALERALAPERRALDIVLSGLFVYLVLAAGWPITVLMIALVSVCLVVGSWLRTRSLLAPWPAVLAWVFALGWAAPALMMFLEYGKETHRVSTGLELDHQWMVPVDGLRGLILATPTFWRSYQGNYVTRPSAELANGIVPLTALMFGLYRRGGEAWRGARTELVLAVAAFTAAALPCVRPFQSSFRWLPLAHLALALVGAGCLRAVGSERTRNEALRIALLAGASVAFVLLIATGESLDPTLTTRQLGKCTLVLAAAWAAVELISNRRLRSWPAVAFSLASLGATYHYLPPLPDSPRWTMPDAMMRANEPYRPELRYLALFDYAHMLLLFTPPGEPAYWLGGASALRLGYTAMYADLDFANGFSAMMPLGPTELMQFGHHGEINPWHASHLMRIESGEGGLLDLMAVDGLVMVNAFLGDQNALMNAGWHPSGIVDGGTMFERNRGLSARVRSLPGTETVTTTDEVIARVRAHRDGPVALVLLGKAPARETFAIARLENLRERRLDSRVTVDVPVDSQPALVMFSRPWLPGWKASLDGKDLPVEQVDLMMPAVRVPPGAHGELVLRYRPRSLWIGGALALVTLLVAAGWLLIERRRRRN